MMLFSGIFCTLIFAMPLWASRVTLRGLVAKSRTASSTSFTLADGMILVALISLATTLGANVPIGKSENWILIASANLLAILMWYRCIGFMDQNKIHDNSSRVVMQLLIYPCSIVAPACLFVCGLYSGVGGTSILHPDDNEPSGNMLPSLVVWFAVSCGWVYLTRVAFRMILDRNNALTSE